MEQSYQTEEITLKELLVLAKSYMAELWSKKWLVLLFCIVFMSVQWYRYSKTFTTYPASLTFMIDEGESGLGMSGLLGSLGDVGSGESNYEKIVALSQSMRIIGEVMLTKVEVEGVNDYLGNHVIRLEKIQEKEWGKVQSGGKTSDLNNFVFKRDSISVFTRQEYSALKYLQDYLKGNKKNPGVFEASFNNDSGIIEFEVACRSEALSIALLNTFYDKLSAFYIEKKVGKNYVTYNIVKQKVDSIRRALHSVEVRQANFEDANHSVLLNVERVPASRYNREKEILSMAYAEAIQNLEMADFAVKSSAPYIQLIDNAVPPLKSSRPSLINMLLMAAILGGLAGSFVVVLRKFFVSL